MPNIQREKDMSLMNNEGKIKVLLVDDSPIALAILKRMLAISSDIDIVGTALNGSKALKLIPVLEPDVICTDINMPVMDGYQLTKEVMERFPRPILVVSTEVQEDQKDNVFNLLEMGALDVFPKPRSGLSLQDRDFTAGKTNTLIEKVKNIARLNVKKKTTKKAKTKKKTPSPSIPTRNLDGNKVRIIVFGGGVGAPQVLKTVLTQFSFNFPIPIICVQHISDEFLQNLVDWLASNCQIRVRIAQDGNAPRPGVIYFPKPGSHLEIDSDGNFSSQRKLPYKSYRPSISVTLNSVSNYYHNKVLGILLSGMGSDGVEGLQKVKQRGGITLVQSEESSVADGMISQALKANVVDHVLNIDEISEKIISLLAK
jgi:two-component system chemotaxis response regulator CheB